MNSDLRSLEGAHVRGKMMDEKKASVKAVGHGDLSAPKGDFSGNIANKKVTANLYGCDFFCFRRPLECAAVQRRDFLSVGNRAGRWNTGCLSSPARDPTGEKARCCTGQIPVANRLKGGFFHIFPINSSQQSRSRQRFSSCQTVSRLVWIRLMNRPQNRALRKAATPAPWGNRI